MTHSSVKFSGAGVFFIVMTLIGWSSVPLFLKHFAGFFDAWTANGWRYGISALFWSPVLIIAARRGTLPQGLWKAAIVPSVVNCLGQNCFAWAPYYINPGMMTFILRFNIIVIALGAYLIFPSERRILKSWSYWVGLALVLGGCAGVIFLGREVPNVTRARGIALAIAGGFFFAFYSLSVRYYMTGFHPVSAFAAISVYTSVVLVAMMIPLSPDHGRAAMSLSAGQFALLAASSLAGIALGHAFYYAGLARLGVAVSSGIVLLQPVLASIGSYFIFDERLTTAQWAGGLGAICGAMLILRAQHRLTQRERSRTAPELFATAPPAEPVIERIPE